MDMKSIRRWGNKENEEGRYAMLAGLVVMIAFGSLMIPLGWMVSSN
jgi:hypothetical protein